MCVRARARTEASLAAGGHGGGGWEMARGVEENGDTKNRPFLALQRDDVDNRHRAAVASTHNQFKMAAAECTRPSVRPTSRHGTHIEDKSIREEIS